MAYSLSVHIIEAMDVTSASKRTKYLKGSPDLYCSVSVSPSTAADLGKQRTKVASKPSSPRWKEVKEFSLLPGTVLADVKVEFEIYDQNRGRDSSVAKGSFPISRYAGKGLTSGEEWVNMQSTTSSKKEACGRLHVLVTWTKLAYVASDTIVRPKSPRHEMKKQISRPHHRARKAKKNNRLYRCFSSVVEAPSPSLIEETCTIMTCDLPSSIDGRLVITEGMDLQLYKGRRSDGAPWRSFPLHHCQFTDIQRQELLDSYDSTELYGTDVSSSDGAHGADDACPATRTTSPETLAQNTDALSLPPQEEMDAVMAGIVQFQALYRSYRVRKRMKQLAKGTKQRVNLVKELLSTERKYVANLEVLSEVLLSPMAERRSLKPLVEQLAPCARQLLVHHRDLLERLEPLANNWSEQSTGLGELFVLISSFSFSYTQYVKSYSQVLPLISAARKDVDIGAFLQHLEADPRCNHSQMSSFLILPVQRVPRYRMFLADLIKYSPAEHQDLAKLQEAAADISVLATSMDSHCLAIENVKKVLSIQEKILGDLRLAEPSRLFVRESSLTLWPSMQAHHIILLNDMLLVAQDLEVKEGPTYKLRSAHKLSELELFELGDCMLQLCDAKTGLISVMLSCKSSGQRDLWATDIRKLLHAPATKQEHQKQAFENQLRMQSVETSCLSFTYCGNSWKLTLENRIKKDAVVAALLKYQPFLRGKVVSDLSMHVGNKIAVSSASRSASEKHLDISGYSELVKLTADDDSCHEDVQTALRDMLMVVEQEHHMASLAETHGEHVRRERDVAGVHYSLLKQKAYLQAETSFAQPHVWKKLAVKTHAPLLATNSQKSTLLSGFLQGTSNLGVRRSSSVTRPRRASVADMTRERSGTPEVKKRASPRAYERELSALRDTLDSVVASQNQSNSTVASLLVSIEKQEAVSDALLRFMQNSAQEAGARALDKEKSDRLAELEKQSLVKDKEIELLHLRLASLEEAKRLAEVERQRMEKVIEQQAANTELLQLLITRVPEREQEPAGEVKREASINDESPGSRIGKRNLSLMNVGKSLRKKKNRDDKKSKEPRESKESKEEKKGKESSKKEQRAAIEKAERERQEAARRPRTKERYGRAAEKGGTGTLKTPRRTPRVASEKSTNRSRHRRRESTKSSDESGEAVKKSSSRRHKA